MPEIRLGRRLGSLILVVLLSLAVVYLLISAMIIYRFVRPASSPIERTPALLGLKYDDISFPSRLDKLLLKGWLIHGGERGSIIVTSGGKSNRADEGIRLLDLCADLARRGYNVLTYDRRGCGDSPVPGLRNRACYERDLGGALDFLHAARGKDEPIYLLGMSLGAAESIIFASEQDSLKGIILDSGFARTREATRGILSRINQALPAFLPGAALIGRLLYNFHPVDPLDRVTSVRCPILLIHGHEDADIPAQNSAALFQTSGQPENELWIVPGSAHCQAYSLNSSAYTERVVSFLEKCACLKASSP